jgi:hypothetical protein
VTDDFQSDENEVRLVHAAMRLARRVSRVLGAQRGRPTGEAEREATLREAFEYAAGAELPGPIPAAPKTKESNLPDAETLLNNYFALRMGRRVQPRASSASRRMTPIYESRADDSSAPRG